MRFKLEPPTTLKESQITVTYKSKQRTKDVTILSEMTT